MLKFIAEGLQEHLDEYLFKYISCWSLSEEKEDHRVFLLKFKYISCWSLSAREPKSIANLTLFKYISCWSLSVQILHNMMVTELFKYISCWSLSLFRPLRASIAIDLNTSHVEVYRCRHEAGKWGLTDLNTSHVEVYLAMAYLLPFCYCI